MPLQDQQKESATLNPEAQNYTPSPVHESPPLQSSKQAPRSPQQTPSRNVADNTHIVSEQKTTNFDSKKIASFLMNDMALTQEQAIQVILQSPSSQTINNAVTQAQSPEYTSFSQELGGNPMSPEVLMQKLQQANNQPPIDMSYWRA